MDITAKLYSEALYTGRVELTVLLHDAADEIKRLRKLTQWQPIETAPKDGERILVVWLGDVDIAFWNIEQENWEQWPNGDFVCDTDEITHWMPLPKPPKEDE